MFSSKTSTAASATTLLAMTLAAGHAHAVSCTANATTISADCANLVISNSNLTVTINAGTTVYGPNGIALWNQSSAGNTTIINNGTITTYSGPGYAAGDEMLYNPGSISSLLNTGTISGNYHLFNAATIGTLTNTGTITGGFHGIYNTGTIDVLNNLQGAANSVLNMTQGIRPLQYNIIVQSTSNYGQLDAASSTGPMAFNIYGNAGTTLVSGVNASVVTANRYQNVLQGFTSLAGVTGTTGSYGGYNYSLVANATLASSWDLLVSVPGPTSADTQAALGSTASAISRMHSMQGSILANSLAYDCAVFSARQVCVSVNGRNYTAANGLNSTSALLIAAYRVSPAWRIGAYADQNVSDHRNTEVTLDHRTPLIGLFGVWNARQDGTGSELKVSLAYGQKHMTVNRQVVGSSEAGSGTTSLNSQGVQILGKHGFGVTNTLVVSPYAGLRYLENKSGGYTEGTSASVTSPLTYGDTNASATTALAGVGLAYRGIPKAELFASAGVEADTHAANGSLSASGVSGLTAVGLNGNGARVRPTATAGAAVEVRKHERLGIVGLYRQEAYQSASTTTVLVTYTLAM